MHARGLAPQKQKCHHPGHHPRGPATNPDTQLLPRCHMEDGPAGTPPISAGDQVLNDNTLPTPAVRATAQVRGQRRSGKPRREQAPQHWLGDRRQDPLCEQESPFGATHQWRERTLAERPAQPEATAMECRPPGPRGPPELPAPASLLLLCQAGLSLTGLHAGVPHALPTCKVYWHTAPSPPAAYILCNSLSGQQSQIQLLPGPRQASGPLLFLKP